MNAVRKKMVIVGNASSGKTSVLNRYRSAKFNETYVPTIFSNTLETIREGNILLELCIGDTSGQIKHRPLRHLSYADVNVIVICYSIDSQDSFDNIIKVWIPEVKNYCPNIPIILLGNKINLRARTNNDGELVTNMPNILKYEDGRNIANTVKALAYLECSAKTNEGIDHVFEHIIRTTCQTNKNNEKKQICSFL